MNPAVAKLFEDVENPIIKQAAIQALALREPLKAENLPGELVEPLFILAAVAREMHGAPIVDNPAALRERIQSADETCGVHHQLTWALLDGAGFNTEPRKFPDVAKMNCEPGEVRLHFLPDGARFKIGTRTGQLIYRTPSRAVITLSGGKTEKTFKNNRTGEDVTISASGLVQQGCALDAPVTPIYTAVSHEDRVWAINAWKEITGVFEEETPKQKGTKYDKRRK